MFIPDYSNGIEDHKDLKILRQEIENHIKTFLKNGGKIQYLPPDASGIIIGEEGRQQNKNRSKRK